MQVNGILKILGASNHTDSEREKNDFYSTDPDCVEDLLKVENFGKDILEPCCGTGNISKVLQEHGYNVMSTDLVDRGFGTGGVDFFTAYHKIDMDIVTNPPFGLATEFVEHALKCLTPGHKMALFLKLQFLEGQDRFIKVFKQKKLETVYVYSKRVACYKNDDRYQKDSKGNIKMDKAGKPIKMGSAVAFVWMIFNTEYNDDPRIKFITNFETEQAQSSIQLFNVED